MIKKIALVLVILVGVILAYAATKPDAMHVERSVTVNAEPDRVFPFINDFHNWAAWSPYERMAPGMRKTYSGAPDGKGAIYEWAGNSQVGKGRMEILDASRPSRVEIKLDFIEPFEGHNVAVFSIVPDGGATKVTWAMDGPSPYVAKLMGVFMDMDRMIGSDFENGLATIKTLAEK